MRTNHNKMNYFKLALRALARDRFYSIINIGGLTLGMCTALFILLWVKDELTFDRFHSKGDNIYRVYGYFPKADWITEAAPYPLGEAAMAEIPEIKEMTRLRNFWSASTLEAGDNFTTTKEMA